VPLVGSSPTASASGSWSNRTTPAPQAGNPGAIPGDSTYETQPRGPTATTLGPHPGNDGSTPSGATWLPRYANWQSGLARAPPRSGGRRRLPVRLRPGARPGRQTADHLGLEPGMLWVRVPPGPLETDRPRGAAWSARLPVTQEIAGSNPVEGAIGEWRRGTQIGKAAKLKPW
jgi:hypothetical protein